MPSAAPRDGVGGGCAVGAGRAVPDWRDASAYDWLLGASRGCFAWEWLRRSDAYRSEWETAFGAFGLLAPVDPDHDSRLARPVWASCVDRSVLYCVVDDRAGRGDRLDLGAIVAAMSIGGDGVEHWLVSDGLRSIRIDCVAGSLGVGPVPVRWLIDGVACAEPAMLALRRLIVVARTGRLGGGLFAAERKAARWIMALRVWDALACGASQFDIGEALFDVAGPRWRVVSSSSRLRVQRLVRASRDYARRPVSWWLG